MWVFLSDDLSWQKNTKFICEKARRKIWILRRMVELDLDPFIMLKIEKMLNLVTPLKKKKHKLKTLKIVKKSL